MDGHRPESLYDHLDTDQRQALALMATSLGIIDKRLHESYESSLQDGLAVRVVDLLDLWLLDEEQKRDLRANNWDIFFLIASAYEWSSMDEVATTDYRDKESQIDTIGSRSEIIQLNSRDQSKAIDNRQIEIINLISNGILNVGTGSAALPLTLSYGGGDPVHIQFLAASLRLATAFILDCPATIKEILSLLPLRSDFNATRLRKCYTVLSVGPHPHLQAAIRVRLKCTHSEVHRALKRYESRTQHLLSGLNRIVRPRFLFTMVYFEIIPDGYQPIDLRFNVDTSSALQLFMGDTLYTDRRVFLRELIQNSVDACNLRQLYEPDHIPAIHVDFNSDISEIKVRDNGVGMSKQWIEKYFLNIGLSFYQSDEIIRINRDADIQFSFISRFGIGFLSCFLVADKVIVKTRQAGEDGLSVTITNINDYFDVRLVQEKIPVGTEVTIVLKENDLRYSRSLEYLGYLKTNVRFLPISVTVTDEQGMLRTLGQETMDYNKEIRWGTKFTAKLNYNSSKGYLLLRVVENTEYIYDLEASQGGISIFQDGIFITQVDYLLPESARSHIVGRLNLVGEEKCELSMDRNRIYWGKDQLGQTKKRVLAGMVTIANRLMETVDQKPTPDNVVQNLSRKVATFFDFNDIDDTLYANLHQTLRSEVDKNFQLFVRANRYQFNLSRSKSSQADDSHGYVHDWQQHFINELKVKTQSQREALN